MKITISGSMQFEPRMSEVGQNLIDRGYETVWPSAEDRGDFTEVGDKLRKKLIEGYFDKIDTSEALLVVNEAKNGIEGYIGGNALIEMAHAFSQGLDIFLMNPVPDMSYSDEIRGMQPIIMNGSLDVLDQYIDNLPLVYMSTTSALKHAAVARGMRRAGVPVRVDGAKIESGVNEQPLTAQETYEGAMNRHAALKQLGKAAAYYVTVESGQHPIHKDHSLFGCNVVIVEPAGREPKVGIHLDVEFPREMLDLVPSVYPDLGELVQQKYGATERDPLAYFTNGRLTRRQTIERAIYDVVAQLVEGKK